MGNSNLVDNACRAGQVYTVEIPDNCVSIGYKCYADAVKDEEREAQLCVKSLEQRTRLPHYAAYDNGFGYGPTSGPSTFRINWLQGCAGNAKIKGEYDAKLCAQELSRVRGTPFEAKLVSSHWFWANEYAIQKK